MSELLIDQLETIGKSLIGMAVAYEAPQLVTILETLEAIGAEAHTVLKTKQLSPADAKRVADLAFAATMAAKWGPLKT